MSTPIVKSLVDEQIEELPAHMAIPDDRVLLIFKGLTMADAMRQAELASIENPAAWSGRACMCGLWTLMYEVRT